MAYKIVKQLIWLLVLLADLLQDSSCRSSGQLMPRCRRLDSVGQSHSCAGRCAVSSEPHKTEPETTVYDQNGHAFNRRKRDITNVKENRNPRGRSTQNQGTKDLPTDLNKVYIKSPTEHKGLAAHEHLKISPQNKTSQNLQTSFKRDQKLTAAEKRKRQKDFDVTDLQTETRNAKKTQETQNNKRAQKAKNKKKKLKTKKKQKTHETKKKQKTHETKKKPKINNGKKAKKAQKAKKTPESKIKKKARKTKNNRLTTEKTMDDDDVKMPRLNRTARIKRSPQLKKFHLASSPGPAPSPYSTPLPYQAHASYPTPPTPSSTPAHIHVTKPYPTPPLLSGISGNNGTDMNETMYRVGPDGGSWSQLGNWSVIEQEAGERSLLSTIMGLGRLVKEQTMLGMGTLPPGGGEAHLTPFKFSTLQHTSWLQHDSTGLLGPSLPPEPKGRKSLKLAPALAGQYLNGQSSLASMPPLFLTGPGTVSNFPPQRPGPTTSASQSGHNGQNALENQNEYTLFHVPPHDNRTSAEFVSPHGHVTTTPAATSHQGPPRHPHARNSSVEWAGQVVQCECDPLCHLYGDCCADYYQLCQSLDISHRTQWKEMQRRARHAAEATSPNHHLTALVSRMGCQQALESHPYVYMVDRCDDRVRTYQPFWRRRCEGLAIRDDLTSLPLPLLADRRVVFRNVFCAFCNGLHYNQLDQEGSLVYHTCHQRFFSQVQFLMFLQTGICNERVNDTVFDGLRRCVRPSLVHSQCLRADPTVPPEASVQSYDQAYGHNDLIEQGYRAQGVQGRALTDQNAERGAELLRRVLDAMQWVVHNYRDGADTVYTPSTGGVSSKSKSKKWKALQDSSENKGDEKPDAGDTELNCTDANSKFVTRSTSQFSADSGSTSPAPCTRKLAKKKARQPSPKRLTSSRELCGVYKYYISVSTSNDSVSLDQSEEDDEELIILANPDCLACSVGIFSPQLPHVSAVCSVDQVLTMTTPPLPPSVNTGQTFSTLGESIFIGLAVNETGAPLSYYPSVIADNNKAPSTTPLPNYGGGAGNPGAVTGPAISAFRVFFQLYDNSWEYKINDTIVLPQVLSCPDDQVFLPYINDCQPFMCGPHTYPYRGLCLLSDRLLANSSLQPFPWGATRYTISLTIPLSSPGTDSDAVSKAANDNKVYDGFLTIADDIGVDDSWGPQDYFYLSSAYAELLQGLSANVTSLGPLIQADGLNFTVSAEEMNNKDRKNLNVSVLVRIEVELRNGSLHDVVLLSVYLANLTVPADHVGSFRDLQATSATVSSKVNFSDASVCPNGTLRNSRTSTLVVDGSKSYFLETFFHFYDLKNIGFELLTYSKDDEDFNGTTTLRSAVFCDNDDDTGVQIRCGARGYVPLNASLFVADNYTLTVLQNGDVFNRSQFQVYDNGSAIVCSVYDVTYVSNATYRTYFIVMKDYVLEGSLAITTLSLSMLSLVLLLVVYFLLPQLRNVPGVIVMSYSGSLLVSQAMTLLAGYPRTVQWVCTLHACITHASMLSSFLWKSALSFDLVFMLRLKSVENSSHSSRVFMLNCYSAVGWALPAVAVLFLWLLDHYGLYDIGYGDWSKGVCWIGTMDADIFLLMLPMVLAWLFNIVCFAVALYLIRQSSLLHSKAVTKSNSRRSSERRRLMAYARISVLMGTTWILCFVAMALNLDELWLAHIVLNGSQGIYLLFCFVIKRRVWIMLRDRLKRKGSIKSGGDKTPDSSDFSTFTTTTSSSAVLSGVGR